MKRQIRHGVFETNSSSTHSLTTCMVDDFEKWKRGEVYLNERYGAAAKFIGKDDVIDVLKRYESEYDLAALSDEEFDEIAWEYDVYTYDNYDAENLDWFQESYTTPNGDEVIAFGQYGYDG